MSNQIVITSGAKVRNLNGVLTGTAGVVDSVPLGGANGVATLDSSGKVPVSQLPASVVTYLGTWNAATNTPTLTNGVGDAGDMYLCNVAGTVDFGAGPISFNIGDWVLYGSGTWQKSNGQNGTVTSVDMTVPTGLAISGNPITTSGTLALSLASGYTIPTTSFLSGLVPYTGATGNVDLGTYGIKADYSQFNLTPSSIPTTVGTLSWDSEYRTLQLIDGDGDTTLQIGQEQRALIHNGTGSTLTDGQVVYVTGSTGQLPSVALASNALESTSSVTFGVVTETIPHGSDGFVTISGMVNGLNTLAFNEGDALYLGATAGTFTNVKPTAPANLVLVGYVIKKAGGNGSIFVKIQNGYELEELHDVLITSVANNQGIFWDSATSLWKNKTIAGALGYTPANAATYVPYSGATNDLNLGSHDLYLASVFAQGTLLSNNGLRIEGDGVSEGGNLQFKQYASVTAGALGYTTLSANDSTSFNIYFNQPSSTNYKNVKLSSSLLTNNIIRTYSFPDASGTLALTSDLSSYVPYTGATSNVVLGSNNLSAQHLIANGVTGSYGGSVLLKQNANAGLSNNYTSLSSSGLNFIATAVNGAGVLYEATFNLASITTNRSYTLPDASGTIALTSNIPTVSGTSGQVTYFNGTSSVTGSNNFFWDATNNRLGIGLTNPQRALEIYSATADSHLRLSGSAPSVSLGEAITGSIYQAKFGLATANGQYASGAVAGDFVILSQTGATIFMTNATEKMRVNTSGRLLLGTTTDNGSLLQVAGSATFSGLATIKSVDITESSANTYGTLAIRGNSRGGEIDFYNTSTLLAAIYADASKNLYLQTDGTTRLTISSTGAATFSSTIDAASRVLAGSSSNTSNAFSGINNSAAQATIYSYNHTASGWSIYSAQGINYFANNVGIGTSSPNRALEILNTSTQLRLSYDATTFSEIRSDSSGGLLVSAGGGYIINYIGGSEKMRITSSGNVRINSTSDINSRGVLLQVSGPETAQLYGYGNGYGIGLFMCPNSAATGTHTAIAFRSPANGDVGSINTTSTTTTYNITSDYRLKQDLKTFNGLDLISEIKTYDFEWKEDNSRMYGVLAHELQEVLPQAVTGEKDGEEMQGVDYSKIVPILVKAIQELKLEIDELKNK